MSQNEPSGTSAQPAILPEHIRQNLKNTDSTSNASPASNVATLA